MTSPLEFVCAQFPHVGERLACLFERDAIFRELCEDYESCSRALSRQVANEGLRREYAALRLRLGTELLTYLEEAGPPPSRE